VFAETIATTDPDRVLAVFGGSVIHDASAAAAHEQPVNVSTVRVTAPPFADTVVLAGVTIKRHGAASCSSPTSILLTSIAARRCTASGFAATR
jgi:hypothetical protein